MTNVSSVVYGQDIYQHKLIILTNLFLSLLTDTQLEFSSDKSRAFNSKCQRTLKNIRNTHMYIQFNIYIHI